MSVLESIRFPKELANLRPSSWDSVEGKVESFQCTCRPNQGIESFSVSGIKFDYSDSMSSGFHRTSCRGGPMREGLTVRIHYLPMSSGNLITRLEVKE